MCVCAGGGGRGALGFLLLACCIVGSYGRATGTYLFRSRRGATPWKHQPGGLLVTDLMNSGNIATFTVHASTRSPLTFNWFSPVTFRALMYSFLLGFATYLWPVLRPSAGMRIRKLLEVYVVYLSHAVVFSVFSQPIFHRRWAEAGRPIIHKDPD